LQEEKIKTEQARAEEDGAVSKDTMLSTPE
jgi:hypothetical protein